MKQYYRRMKIFFVIYFTFIIMVFVPWLFSNIMDHEWGMVILLSFAFVWMSGISLLIFTYYRNIVIDVDFDGDTTIITTNCKLICLPSKNFVEVIDSRFLGRTILKYNDGTTRKRFIFQKQYSPFKTYSLDLVQMRKNMSHAIFIEK